MGEGGGKYKRQEYRRGAEVESGKAEQKVVREEGTGRRGEYKERQRRCVKKEAGQQ